MSDTLSAVRAAHRNGDINPASFTTAGNLDHFRCLAEDYLADVGLDGWKFRWDQAVRRAGLCNHRTRTISISSVRAEHDLRENPAELVDTLTHEVAHALLPPHVGHSSVWRRLHRDLGGSGARCGDGPSLCRWQASCCGRRYARQRFTRVVTYHCNACRTPSPGRTGTPASPDKMRGPDDLALSGRPDHRAPRRQPRRAPSAPR